MDWQLLLDNSWKIITLVVGLVSVVVSPVVLLRWLRTRNELTEIQTFIKKNEVIREEISKMNAELSDHAARIRELELLLLDEQLRNKALVAENTDLVKRLQLAEQALHDIQDQAP